MPSVLHAADSTSEAGPLPTSPLRALCRKATGARARLHRIPAVCDSHGYTASKCVTKMTPTQGEHDFFFFFWERHTHQAPGHKGDASRGSLQTSVRYACARSRHYFWLVAACCVSPFALIVLAPVSVLVQKKLIQPRPPLLSHSRNATIPPSTPLRLPPQPDCASIVCSLSQYLARRSVA